MLNINSDTNVQTVITTYEGHCCVNLTTPQSGLQLSDFMPPNRAICAGALSRRVVRIYVDECGCS